MEKESSDFDDIDFEEREKEAGIRGGGIGGGANRANDMRGGVGVGAAKDVRESQDGGGGGDLDFDDLEF